MVDRSVLIRVPATVGNFGGAVDCAALALDAALNVRASARRDGGVSLRYFGENGERVPRDASNLAVRAMKAALEFRGLPFGGIDFEMYGTAPVGVGLGSSTAAVWAGLLVADRLYRLGLGEKTLFDLAGTLEQRNDNLRAAWSGGFVSRFEESALPVYHSTVVPDNLSLHVVIPEMTAVRNHEPSSAHSSGGEQSGFLNRAQTLRSFLAQPRDSETAGLETATEGIAERTVPGLDEALAMRVPGLQAAFVCGSGPSVGILAKNEDAEAVTTAVIGCLARHGVSSRSATFRATNSGACDWNARGTELRLAPQVGLDMPNYRTLPV
jgi:homoserine kinase